MTPLDLSQTPPRSPREEVGGLCMLPRMIDIARAKLAGGNVGEYQIGRGVSGLVLGYLGVSVDDFVECVRAAEKDEDVAARMCSLRPAKENRALGLRLRRLTVADVPADLREQFERFYGADLPTNKRVFDVLEENDAQAFPEGSPRRIRPAADRK